MEYRSECEEEGTADLLRTAATAAPPGRRRPSAGMRPHDLLPRRRMKAGLLSGVPYWATPPLSCCTRPTAAPPGRWSTIGPVGTVRGFRAMWFSDADEGWMLADGTSTGTLVLHTVDGGAHWGAIDIARRGAWNRLLLGPRGRLGGRRGQRDPRDQRTAAASRRSPRATQQRHAGGRARTSRSSSPPPMTASASAPTQIRVGDGLWEDTATRW